MKNKTTIEKLAKIYMKMPLGYDRKKYAYHVTVGIPVGKECALRYNHPL